ncbi:MAG: FkbM family methyltransferase [candidate division SR1 bacterium]|nr:FkbM family methyltransferase [candidate division SR1 bacterium]
MKKLGKLLIFVVKKLGLNNSKRFLKMYDNFFPYIANNADGFVYQLSKSFTGYIENKEQISRLTSNMDQESKEIVKKEMRMRKYVLERKGKFLSKHFLGIDRRLINKIDRQIEKIKKNYILPIKEGFGESTFYYNHGIHDIEGLKEYVKGKDVVDCGGYIGDSSLMFTKELNINKCYCLEPMEENFELALKTIKLNNIGGKIIPIKKGVGKAKGILKIKKDGPSSYIDSEGDCSIQIDTIDSLIKEYNINPGLIKYDVEGSEYDAILGTEETIRKYKPILLISIYHKGKDYFEIKPLIESWGLGYKFKIRNYCPRNPRFETMLLCY